MAVTFDDVSTDLLKDYEEILKAYYLELNPTADVSNGSAIHELVIRPAAAIYARNEVALEDLRTQYSLNLLSTTTDPDETLATNLAANFKVVRKDGTPGTGTLAVYTNQTNDIYLNSGTTVTAGAVELELTKTYVGVADDSDRTDTDTVKYRQFVKTGDTEYAFLVPVNTVDNTAAVVEEGATATLTGQNTQVTRLEVASAVSGGSAEETTTELVDRVINGITAKVPSGKAHIQALFEEQDEINVRDLAIFGMGDPEMLRDKNNVFLISTGSRVDIYCKTAQLPATLVVQKTATSTDGINWSMFFERDEAPGWYYISKVSHVGNARVITDSAEFDITFLYQQEDDGPEVFSGLTARYSPYQTAKVDFSYVGAGSTSAVFNVSLVYMPQLEGLQELINAPSIRNKQQDNLVKGAVPAYVGMDLTLNCLNDCSGIDLSVLKDFIAAYINELPMGRGFLSVSDLAVVINANYSNLTLSFPSKLSLTNYMPDGSVYQEETQEGVLNMHEDLTQSVSAENTSFFCRPGDIYITIED